jgi:MFS family permease
MTAKPANGHDRNHGERRPLLRTHSSDDASDQSSVQSAQVQEWTRNGMIVVAMCFMVVGLFPGVDALLDVGGLEILEGILCRRTHGDVPNPPTDPRCKDAAVQGEFARLTALSFTLSFIPGLTAVTWGVVAEKYGRKPVLVLSLTSLFAMNAIDIVICTSLYHSIFQTY